MLMRRNACSSSSSTCARVLCMFFVSLLAGCNDDGWRAKECLRQRRAMRVCAVTLYFSMS